MSFKIRFYYLTLFVFMFPWVQLHYHVFNGAWEQGYRYLTYETMEYMLPYVILIYAILKSRVLLFWLAGIFVLQRIIETVLFILQGKFVLGASAVLFKSVLLFPWAQIVGMVQSNLRIFIISGVVLAVVIYVYIRIIRAIYAYYKTVPVKRIYRPFLREAVCIGLVVLGFANRSHTEIFFFEKNTSNFFIQPIYVDKSPPISQSENIPFDLDVYYVRGESATPEHMSLYGYERDTTPFLRSIKSKLTIYENVFAPASGSAAVDSQMFSTGYKLPDNDFFTKPHMLEELAHNNIPVMYLGYQRDFGRYQNYVYDSLINSAEQAYFTEEQDGWDILQGDYLLADLLIKYANPYATFYFFHTGGSHVAFYDRPLPSGVLRYADETANTQQQYDINHYDDSIRYTDVFLQKLYQVAEQRAIKTKRPYVIWYVSDHSYILYRDGGKWQSYNLDGQSLLGRDVPFFIVNQHNLPCANRLPTPQRDNYLNTTQTFYWILGSLCLYNGDELHKNPPVLNN